MNTIKVLHLISLLQNGTTGKEELLARLYENAIQDNPEYKELHSSLQDYVFYAGMGKSLHQNGQNLIRSANENPAGVFDTIRAMRQVNELIQHEAKSCHQLMEQPGAFVEPITVLEKKKIPDYLNFLELLAATCTYLIAVYDGVYSLKQMTWVEGSDLAERLHAVNLVYLPALCQIDTIPKAWLVTRKNLGGRNLLGGTFFSISYVSLSHLKVVTSGLRIEQLTPHMALNKRAAETGETEVLYCWGVGNVVSASPKDGLQLLEGCVTKLAAPAAANMMTPPQNPLVCAQKLAGRAHFCISPDDLVAELNRWQMGYEVTRRKSDGICLICGKPISHRHTVCPTHFFMKGV